MHLNDVPHMPVKGRQRSGIVRRAWDLWALGRLSCKSRTDVYTRESHKGVQ